MNKQLLREKSSSANGQAIKRGGGKGRAIKEKITFLNTKKDTITIELDGGGVKALMAWPLVEELFLRLPLPDPFVSKARQHIPINEMRYDIII